MKHEFKKKHAHEHKKHAHHEHHDHHGHPHDHGELLRVNDLWVEYTAGKKVVHAVNGVSFSIRKGESLGIVGESGCGKSTIAKAILRIMPDHGARIPGGEIWFKGRNLAEIPEKEMERIRGAQISMIFQDPMTALNPVKRILTQVASVIRLHSPGMTKKESEQRAIKMLKVVGISEDRVRDYPHQFSGGMQQRVEVAIGLSCHPDLLLADEPTTALDVTIQAQVLDLIHDLMVERNTALMLITHNLGIVAQMCDYVAVIYGGEIVEYGTKREVFKNPTHPYTIGLFGAIPSMQGDEERLKPIAGIMPEPSELPEGCKFHTRCPYATERCSAPGTVKCFSGVYGIENGVVSCGPVNEADGPSGEHFGNGGISVWTLEPDRGECAHAELSGYATPDLHIEKDFVGRYTLREVSSDGEGVFWSLELKDDMTYTLTQRSVVPVHDLGGTHKCQCYNIEAVLAANAKEGGAV